MDENPAGIRRVLMLYVNSPILARHERKDFMDRQRLGAEIIGLTQTLYRVSRGLLRCEADREDAVQSAIEKAWSKAEKLRDERRLKPWLVRILINECYSLLRKKRRETTMASLPDGESLMEDDDARALRDALDTLPADLRMPILLHYMEGLSVSEIASALRCPKGTVLSRMSRGRKQMRMFLES